MSGNNWNTAANWFTDSTFATTTTVPTSSDNVYITSASGAGTITINASAACLDFDSRGFAGTIAGASALSVSGSLYVRGTFSYTGTITMNATSGTKYISSGGKFIPLLTINGAGGTFQLTENYSGVNFNSVITLSAGTFDSNNKNISIGKFTTTTTGTKYITFGSSAITILGIAAVNDFSTANTNLNANTATITFTSNGYFDGGSLTAWNKLYFIGGASRLALLGSFSCAELTIQGTANNYLPITIAGNVTVSTALKFLGKTNRYRLVVKSSVIGTQRTITNNGTLQMTKVDFSDMIGAGSTAWSGGFQIGDGGNNTNITTDSPRTLFWVAASGGNWGDTTSWATTSGGTTKVAIPLVQDSVVFSSVSITSGGGTITMNCQEMCQGLNMAGVLNTPTFAMGASDNYIYGGVTIGTVNMTGAGQLFLSGRYLCELNISSNVTTKPVFNAPGGTYILTHDLICTGTSQASFTKGTFDMNDFNATMPSVFFTAGFIIYLRSGILTVTLTSLDCSFTGAVFYCGTSTVRFTGTITLVPRQIVINGITFNNFEYLANGTAGSYTYLSGAGTIHDLTIAPTDMSVARYFYIAAGISLTITGKFNVHGNATNLLYIVSRTGGTRYIFNLASGCPQADGTDYTVFTDTNGTGGANWKVGSHSTVSNCLTLVAQDCPASGNDFILNGSMF